MSGTIERWDIWRARIKYEDSDESKERPVLIMNNSVYMISAFKMTGTDRGDNFPEHRIKKWKEAGLDKETSVRLDKALRLDKSVLISRIGHLAVEDIFQIEQKLSK